MFADTVRVTNVCIIIIIINEKATVTSKYGNLVITFLPGSFQLSALVLVLGVEVLVSSQFSLHIVVILLQAAQRQFKP